MNSDMEHNSLEPSGEFAASIRNFRSAVAHVADRETARPVAPGWLAPAQRRRRSAQRRMILGWACAALLCLATLPLSTHSNHPVTIGRTLMQMPAAAAAAPESDTALLEQVDTDVSESVPSPLAPLAELDSWSTQATNNSSDSSVDRTALNSTERTDATH
ncbi:MAG: hypothetical protein WA419_06530 [Silvibacterium sp.]